MSRLVAVVLLLALPACGKKKEQAAAAAPVAERSREEVCRRYADEAIALGRAIGQGVGSGVGLTAEEQRELAAELETELEAERAGLNEECLAWPEEVIACLRKGGLGLDCEELVAKAARARIPKLPAGPAPAWSFALADKPDHVVLADDGVVFASVENTVVAVAGGVQRWSVPFEDADELQLDEDGAVLVISYSADVVALDPATGQERWRLTVPGERHMRVWARAGKDLLLATSDGRFFLRPPGCRTARCLKPAGAIADGDLDGDTDLFVLPDGQRWLVQYGRLHAYGRDGKPLLALNGYDFWTGVAPAAGGLVAAQVGDELVIIDTARCAGEGELFLAAPPRVSADEERCEDCVDPPPGCIAGRARPSSELHRVSPAGAGGAVFVVGDGKLYAREATPGLAARWSLEIFAAASPLPLDDGRVLVHCEDPSGLDATDTPLALCAVGADGQPAWRTPLGVSAGAIFGVDEFHLARRGGWVLAGYREKLVLLPAP